MKGFEKWIRRAGAVLLAAVVAVTMAAPALGFSAPAFAADDDDDWRVAYYYDTYDAEDDLYHGSNYFHAGEGKIIYLAKGSSMTATYGYMLGSEDSPYYKKLAAPADGEDEDFGYEEKKTVWTSSNPCVTVTQDADDRDKASVKAVGDGSATITAEAYSGNQVVETRTFQVQVTDPTISKTSLDVIVNHNYSLKVKGAGGKISYACSDKLDANYAKDVLRASWKSSGKAYAFADGRKLTCKVRAYNPYLVFKPTTTQPFFKKGQKKKFKVKGLPKGWKAKYIVSQAKTASFSKNGTLKAKKYGRAKVGISVKGKKIWAGEVYVVKSKVYRALVAAYKLYKTHPEYSQARRMQKGYVDCSSFVYRSYKKGGVTFGGATTGIAECRWCESHGGKLSLKKYKKKYFAGLTPGDLVFTDYAASRGNYKKIGHVEIWWGNGMSLGANGSPDFHLIEWDYHHVVAVTRPVP